MKFVNKEIYFTLLIQWIFIRIPKYIQIPGGNEEIKNFTIYITEKREFESSSFPKDFVTIPSITIASRYLQYISL